MMEIDAYCDESCQELFRSKNTRQGHHVVIGGLWNRATRINWIRAVLTDSGMERYRRVMRKGEVRCIIVEPGTPYAVVIQLDSKRPERARFITAYVVDSVEALKKMRSNPKW